MAVSHAPSAERILTLEEIVAHQARAIEDLSQQLAAQWKIIDQHDAKLTRLIERFQSIEESSLEAPAITRPPHY
jgi:SlyX protein